MDWSKQMRTAPEWFGKAKFGMFFHWGPYSVPACENEWYSRNMYLKGSKQNLEHVKRFGPLGEFGYKDFLPLFKGENFSAEDWAELVEKTVPVGNASLLGARMALLDPALRARLRHIQAACRYLELSGDRDFNEEYPEQMIFYEEDEDIWN